MFKKKREFDESSDESDWEEREGHKYFGDNKSSSGDAKGDGDNAGPSQHHHHHHHTNCSHHHGHG